MTSEIPNGLQYSTAVFQHMLHGRPLGSIAYNNILLGTTEPGFINEYDGGIESRISAGLFYWPGENPYNQASFETIEFRASPPSAAEAAASAQRTRRAVAGAYIAEAALQRVPPEMQAEWTRREAESSISPLLITSEICRELALPLGVCAVSKVDNRGLDKRTLHMWYPASVHPKPALAKLQQAVLDANAQETL